MNDSLLMEFIEENVNCGIKWITYDYDATIMDVDNRFIRLLGYQPDEKNRIIGTKLEELIHPDDLEQVGEILKSFDKKSNAYNCKYRAKRKDDSYIWIHSKGTIQERDGKRIICSVSVDIDVREKMLRERSAIYKSVAGGIARIVVDKSSYYIKDGNTKFFQLLGTKRTEICGEDRFQVFHEDSNNLRSHIIMKAREREQIDFEFRRKRECDGEIHWYRVIGNFYNQKVGKTEYYCIFTDITEDKANEVQLIRERRRYQYQQRQAVDLIFEYKHATKSLSFMGDLNVRDNQFLCVEQQMIVDYKELLFRQELLYRGDLEAFKKFAREKEVYHGNVRLLTYNKDSGKKYYDFYEVLMKKVIENGKLIRVLGYIKNSNYQTFSNSMRRELHDIFDHHIIKDYSFILKIDIPTRSFIPYMLQDTKASEYQGSLYYDSFISWWCENLVDDAEKEEMLHFLSLEQIVPILRSGQLKGQRFCGVKDKKGKVEYKICSYAFYDADLHTIILTVRDVHTMRSEELYRMNLSQMLLNDAFEEARMIRDSRGYLIDYFTEELSVPLNRLKEIIESQSMQNEEILELRQLTGYMGETIRGLAAYQTMDKKKIERNQLACLYDGCMDVLEAMNNLAETIGIELNVTIDLPEQKMYDIPVYYFKRILVHLMGNAMKYSPTQSEVSVVVQEKKQLDGSLALNILVEDEGPMVDASLFVRKADVEEEYLADRIRIMGDTGASIMLAQKVIERLGGNLQVTTGVFQRSLMEVEIPVKVFENRSEQTKIPDGLIRDADLHGQGILLVEDSANNNLLTPSLLHANGAKLFVASSGEEAFHMLAKFNYNVIDVILVDQSLPDMDCYEFARKLKFSEQDGSIRRIPIIEMRNSGKEGNTQQGLMSGINAVIEKPLNLIKLERLLEQFREQV